MSRRLESNLNAVVRPAGRLQTFRREWGEVGAKPRHRKARTALSLLICTLLGKIVATRKIEYEKRHKLLNEDAL